MEIRDYRPTDLPAIKAIHAATSIDYTFPDINKPIWLVKRVVEHNGKVVAACGLYMQVEAYLWLDPSAWADPETKLAVIEVMDHQVMHEAYLKGIDDAVLYLPPGMERFGERLTKTLGFTKARDGWIVYSKNTENKKS